MLLSLAAPSACCRKHGWPSRVKRRLGKRFGCLVLRQPVVHRAIQRIGNPRDLTVCDERTNRDETAIVPLLARTTRSVALTDAGERLIASVGPHFAEIEAEVESLRASTDRPAGIVRITTTDYAANTYVWPRVQTLLREYPEMRIELVSDYGLSDSLANRFDIGVRLGDRVTKDMIAVRIAADMTIAIVGSPDDVQSRPPARTKADLTRHNCINLRLPTRDSLLPWELCKGRRELHVRVDAQLTFNNVRERRPATPIQ
jgi:DNA-binding transcriptional LysR family regulator